MFPLTGNATLPDAPLGSDGSGTGTLVAPGAGVGIATASLALKLWGDPDGGVAVANGACGPAGGSIPSLRRRTQPR